MKGRERMATLKGKVALVTGGSRGAGKAIAIELGKAGALVYVSGRSTKQHSRHDFPGTIDDTAAEIEAAGGKGIGVYCDHTKVDDCKELIKRIDQEQGRLDILVNNVWGGNELPIDYKPFWELPLKHWDNMFTSGVRAQLTTTYYAIPLLRKNQEGLIVHTTFWDHDKYLGNFYYDLAKHALNRMAYGFSIELKNENIAVVAVSPGFMRTELVLKSFQTDEMHWKEIKALANSETPHYVGRAIAAMADDPQILEKTGNILRAGDLAKEYRFTDIDGRVIRPFEM
jgi:NAD(P)-dependent dehydrogenase (short-subunit alcohol dehydrogenase family)